MPYRIRHSLSSGRFEIVNNQSGRVVGSSTSKKNAQASIEHRTVGEAKNVKSYKRKVDNKMPYFGETDLTKKTIRINKSKKKNSRGDILDTIVHEKEHILHPKKYERNVQKAAKKKVLSMSKKQKQKHYNLFKA